MRLANKKLTNKTLSNVFSLTLLAAATSSAYAADARSIAMGGTGIVTGKGVSGAMLNPALLAKHKKQGLHGSFRIGLNSSIKDQENVYDDVKDAKDTTDALDNEIQKLDTKTVNAACATAAVASTNCVTGVSALRDAAAKTKTLINNVNGKPLLLDGGLNVGFSYVGAAIPFAINVSGTANINTRLNVSNNDLTYLDALINHTGNKDVLTASDIASTDKITVSNTGRINIKKADQTLESAAVGYGVVRGEAALSLATDIPFNNQAAYVGITPRMIKLAAGRVSNKIQDKLDGDKISDQIDADKVEETKFTANAGFLIPSHAYKGLSYAFAVNDFLPYAITTKSGVKIKTETQAVAGIGYETKRFNIALEAALNRAKKDNTVTQPIGLGVEANWSWFGLRAGVSHDLAVKENATSYSLGADIGFVELGAKYNGEKSAEVSLQLASDF